MRKIIVLLVAVILMTLFAGCGGSSGIEGKWETAYIHVSSGDNPGKYKVPTMLTFEFFKDGKLIGSMGVMGEDKEEGTWKMNGDKVTITIDGETRDLIMEKDLLVIDFEELGGKVYLTKDLKNFKYPDDVKDLGF